ncbi:MAG TPA: S9 family peptidase [bacterium]|nr:S9 family peptidase [bacterium]
MSPQTKSYGSWTSPITADLIVSGTIGLDQVVLDGDDAYWIEARPSEGGRHVVVHRTPDGRVVDVTPAGMNARTRVHEYGGGAYTVHRGVVYFSNFVDQRLFRQDPGAPPRPLSPAADMRYADAVIDARRERLVCVREDHTTTASEAVNTLVSLPWNGDDRTGGRILVEGNDFYSSPRLSPDGSRLAWLTWNHPNMPWDGTELWVADLAADGAVARSTRVAGGAAESVFQPEWAPDGTLFFVSDRTGWWNLYRGGDGRNDPVCPMAAEFGVPQWVFGMSQYALRPDGRLICAYRAPGGGGLGVLDPATGRMAPVEMPYRGAENVRCGKRHAVFIAGSPVAFRAVVRLDLDTGRTEVLRRSAESEPDPTYLSQPEAIEFPTEGGHTAYGYYYAPRNPDFAGPADARPPLLVTSHGGPTGAASPTLNLLVQYWTSRGFGYLDVNYGGSTGYGRAYRERLYGQWGVVDVDDCANGARYLVQQDRVDGRRLVIRGGSAGGYTTLCALVFRDAFQAGASHFGIADLEVFRQDTHKFESRYDQHLIGPYPQRRDLYRARSPIHFLDRLARPLILFQGLEDKVVPPNQAEMMFEAVRAKGLPVAYLAYPGEQHGFRRAENIKRTLEAELYFHARVFGFPLADAVDPVRIENLPG